jgi:hypothetical protein
MPKLMVIICANHVTWCSVVERARFSESSSDTGKREFGGTSLCSSEDLRKQVPPYRNRPGMTTLADVDSD